MLLVSRALHGTCHGMHSSPEMPRQQRPSDPAPETGLVGREHPFALSQHSRRPVDRNICDWLHAGSLLQQLANSKKDIALKKQE